MSSSRHLNGSSANLILPNLVYYVIAMVLFIFRGVIHVGSLDSSMNDESKNTSEPIEKVLELERSWCELILLQR